MPNRGLLGTSRSLVFAAALLALPAAWAQATGVNGVVWGYAGTEWREGSVPDRGQMMESSSVTVSSEAS